MNKTVDTARIVLEIARALERKRGLSLISLCDGEAQVLWAARGFQTFHHLAAWGFSAEERLAVAEDMMAAIRGADIVCLPCSGPSVNWPSFAPKLRAALEFWGVVPKREALIGDSLICFYLIFDGWLWGLLEGRRVLIVNNRADAVAQALMSRTVPEALTKYVPADWMRIADAVPIILEDGQAGSAKALAEAKALLPECKPDIALVGAGSRAAHLCVSLADMLSIPVIELGDVLRLLHEGSGERWDTILEWYREEG